MSITRGRASVNRRIVPPALAGVLLFFAVAHAGEGAAPSVTFLDGDAGRAAIVDESIEPYFSLLEPIEMAAKTGRPLEAKDLKAQRDECRKRYQDAVRWFSQDEKDALMALVGRIDAAWANEYPLVSRSPWSFVKVADALEGGFSHTRGRSIVLAESVLSELAQAWCKNPSDAVIRQGTLLAHEQSHVVQRLNPAVFAPLYTGSWGFVRAKDVASDAWLDRQHLVNPDGVDVGWIYPLNDSGGTTYIQPLVVISEGPEPRILPDHYQEIAVTLEKVGASFKPKEGRVGHPVFRPLSEVVAYTSLFGGICGASHPNEVFACLFSIMVVHDHFLGPGLPDASDIAGKDFAELRAWCRAHFAATELTRAK